MTIARITVDGETTVMDLSRFMLSEAEILEEQAGIDIQQLKDLASLENLKMLGALLWLSKLRTIAAEQTISVRAAAQQHPRADFDVNLAAIEVDISEPANPTGGPTSGPTNRTPRAASSKAPKRSPRSAGATAASSRKS